MLSQNRIRQERALKNIIFATVFLLAPLSHAQTVDFRCELPAHDLNMSEASLEARSVSYRVRYHVEVHAEDHYQVWAQRVDQLEFNPTTNEYVLASDHHLGTCCASSDEFFNVELHYGGAVAHHEIKELISIYNLDFEDGSAQFSTAGAVVSYPREYEGNKFVPANSAYYPKFEPYLRLGTCEFSPIENPVSVAMEAFARASADSPNFCDTIRGAIKNTDQLPESSQKHPCFTDESRRHIKD